MWQTDTISDQFHATNMMMMWNVENAFESLPTFIRDQTVSIKYRPLAYSIFKLISQPLLPCTQNSKSLHNFQTLPSHFIINFIDNIKKQKECII